MSSAPLSSAQLRSAPLSSAQLRSALLLILLLSCGLVSPKSMEAALQEFVAVLHKLGTGRCLSGEFQGFLQNAKDCGKHKQLSPTSHYCDDLENIMQCYDHMESCFTGESLDKFKGAALELTVQTIGAFNDEIEDKLQDCPIYTQLVGMRNSKTALYAGIGLGLLVVVAGVAWLIYRKTPFKMYNQVAQQSL